MAFLKLALLLLCASHAHTFSVDDILGWMLAKMPNLCEEASPMPLADMAPTFSIRTSEKNRDSFPVKSDADIKTAVQNLNNDGYFAKDRKVIFIAHGFQGKESQKWPKFLAEAIVAAENDSVVINAYWEKGSGAETKNSKIPWTVYRAYVRAGANTKTVAKGIATFAREIKELPVFKDNPSSLYFHCIGFSLGAHVCGKVGHEAKSMNITFDRVTGLDPAGPNFKNCDKNLGISKNSGKCVDIIHTDAAKAGTQQALGHIDFYPNGGSHQPACGLKKLRIDCSHRRAIALFYVTIKEPQVCASNAQCGVDMAATRCQIKNEKVGSSVMGYFSRCHKKNVGNAGTIGGTYHLTTDDGTSRCNAKDIDMSNLE